METEFGRRKTPVNLRSPRMMGWYGTHMTGWGYLSMGAGMIAFWVLVIAAVVLLARSFTGGTGDGPAQPDSSSFPERILAERFAGGEIDDEEYRRRLEVLSQGDSSARSST
jgi:putative membrane protein